MRHIDICRETVVFRDGIVVGLLDFEFAALAAPSTTWASSRLCVPIEDDYDQARLGWRPANRPVRLRFVADAYGLDRDGRAELLPAMNDAIARIEAAVRRSVDAVTPTPSRCGTGSAAALRPPAPLVDRPPRPHRRRAPLTRLPLALHARRCVSLVHLPRGVRRGLNPPLGHNCVVTATAPTALVSWSHTDPGWDDTRRTQRSESVRALADTLRASGVDCEVDLYHSNEGVDWTRWGPRLVNDQDYVLIVASQSWRAAWEGRGDPTRGAGAAAEADALRSLYARNRDEFVRRVRLIMLPDASRDDVPSGLDGVTRYEVSPSDGTGVAELVRDLTGQPRFRPVPLGPVPALPPEPSGVPSSTLESSESPADQGVSYGPLPGELGFRWRSQWDPHAGSGPSSITVHCLKLPPRAVPVREVLGLGNRIKGVLRSSGVVPDDAALHVLEDESGVSVAVDQPQRRYDEVTRGGVLGVRLDRNGQASVWRSLPRDQMGAVLDPAALEDEIAECFGLVTSLWQAGETEMAVAIELNSVTLISDGVVEDLGRRNRATMIGAMRQDVHLEPDEAVRTSDLYRDRRVIARDLVPIVLRKWRLG